MSFLPPNDGEVLRAAVPAYPSYPMSEAARQRQDEKRLAEATARIEARQKQDAKRAKEMEAAAAEQLQRHPEVLRQKREFHQRWVAAGNYSSIDSAAFAAAWKLAAPSADDIREHDLTVARLADARLGKYQL